MLNASPTSQPDRSNAPSSTSSAGTISAQAASAIAGLRSASGSRKRVIGVIDDLPVEPVDLPETPLPAQRLVVRVGGIQRTGVLLREIEIDRHRLRQHETIVLDRRHTGVGIQRQILGRLASPASAAADRRGRRTAQAPPPSTRCEARATAPSREFAAWFPPDDYVPAGGSLKIITRRQFESHCKPRASLLHPVTGTIAPTAAH